MNGSSFSADTRCFALPAKIRKLTPNARHMALCALLMTDGGLSAQQALAAALAPVGGSKEQQGNRLPLSVLPAIERNLCS